MKFNKFFLIIFLAAIIFVSGNKKASALESGSCKTAQDCATNQICDNGKCLTSTHPISPNAPIVGGNGQIADSKIPGVTTEQSQVIKCGRAGQNMCTLCDLIAGLNYIIKYLMKIAIGVALLAVTIGGVMYVISAGDKGQIDTAKKTMTNAGIGFVIIFAGYLIINTTISYIGSKKDPNTGESTFGMNITSWGNFECTAKDRGGSN